MAYLDSTQHDYEGILTSLDMQVGIMRKGPSTRASGFTESVIREMTRLCQAYGAVNLAQGFPDFDPPVSIKRAAATAISKGLNQGNDRFQPCPFKSGREGVNFGAFLQN